MDEVDFEKSYEGKKIIDVPDITASLGTQYIIYTNYFLKSDLKYMGERYYNVSNTAKESAYTVVNLGAGYSKKSLEIELYANNIFNKEYVNFMIYTPSNDYYHFGAPRVIGINLKKSF